MDDMCTERDGSTVTGWGHAWCLHIVVGQGRAVKKFLTHYLVLSPGLLCVDILPSLAFYFAYIFICLMSFSFTII